MGFVGGAHFHHFGSAFPHDVRNAKGATDLHQLAAGDHHLPASGKGFQGQQDSGRIVVDHHTRLGPCQFLKQVFHMRVTASPAALIEGVFQIAVAAGKGTEFRQNLIGQKGPTQVGVNHHPGGIDHIPEAGHGQKAYASHHILSDGVRFKFVV